MSLLLLRAVLGIALIAEGGFYLGLPASSWMAWPLGLTSLAIGGLLLIGFMTPFAALLAALGGIAVALVSSPASAPVFDSKPAAIFALTMLLTLAGSGPGRFSLDARMFGRREIIIPRSQPRPAQKYSLDD
jgi:uncharacterized membrane protein YphA (DoxX/SURF4 family)